MSEEKNVGIYLVLLKSTPRKSDVFTCELSFKCQNKPFKTIKLKLRNPRALPGFELWDSANSWMLGSRLLKIALSDTKISCYAFASYNTPSF